MTTIQNVLSSRLSDWWITTPIALVGGGFIVWSFLADMSMNHRTLWGSFVTLIRYFPLQFAAMYLWLRAILEDVSRIRRKIDIAPGFVYLTYGMQWVSMWMGYDLLYNSIGARLNPSPTRIIVLYQYPTVFWAGIDVAVSLLIALVRKYVPTQESPYKRGVAITWMRSQFTFYLILIISLLLL